MDAGLKARSTRTSLFHETSLLLAEAELFPKYKYFGRRPKGQALHPNVAFPREF